MQNSRLLLHRRLDGSTLVVRLREAVLFRVMDEIARSIVLRTLSYRLRENEVLLPHVGGGNAFYLIHTTRRTLQVHINIHIFELSEW